MEKSKITKDEIMMLVQAKKEGRLFIAPCKFGEYVYRVIEKAYQDDYFRDGWFAYVKKSKLTEKNFCKLVSEYGKTVFSTEEEAKALLEQVKKKNTGTTKKR